MIEKILIGVVISVPLIYFWAFWLNPVTIKQILKKKGYTIEYIKSHLKKHYLELYGWIPQFLLK